MKSITVCVEFDDLLAITLPRNIRHFTNTLVVTSSQDIKTQRMATDLGAACYTTDVFYERGALFNKGAAMEEGFDELGRDGWICIWDADIVMPQDWGEFPLERDCLYTPKRVLLEDPTQFRDDLVWQQLQSPTQPNEYAGYFQLFHASAVQPPWYGVDWPSAGGCDSDFQFHFPEYKLRRPPFEVLHLGPEGMPTLSTRVGQNWTGRVTRRIDTGKMPLEAGRRKLQVRQLVEDRRTRGLAQEKLAPAQIPTIPPVHVRPCRRAPQYEIPRRISAFWTGRMNWLRYMSLYTLRGLNPDWEICLYSPALTCLKRSWQSPEDDDHAYSGRDYRKLLGDLGITLRSWAPPFTHIAAAQACDIFQWWALDRDGGFYADLDIVWMRPLESLRHAVASADAVFCLESGYMAIGLFASQPGCALFGDLYAKAVRQHRRRRVAYQHYGADLVYREAGLTIASCDRPGDAALTTLRRHYPQLDIHQVPDETVYPYDWRRTAELHCDNLAIPDTSYGLHWFGGAPISRECGTKIRADNWYRKTTTITTALRRAFAQMTKVKP